MFCVFRSRVVPGRFLVAVIGWCFEFSRELQVIWVCGLMSLLRFSEFTEFTLCLVSASEFSVEFCPLLTESFLNHFHSFRCFSRVCLLNLFFCISFLPSFGVSEL